MQQWIIIRTSQPRLAIFKNILASKIELQFRVDPGATRTT